MKALFIIWFVLWFLHTMWMETAIKELKERKHE